MSIPEPAEDPAAGPDADPTRDCAHCGLPVPASMTDANSDVQFCCHACRLVYSVIREHGLEHFYELAGESGAEPRPAVTTGRGYEEFDDPAFHEIYVRPAPGGLSRVDLYLEGVHCAACVWLVERLPLVLHGVAEARLEINRSLARVTWDPAVTPLSAIASRLDALGYPAHPFRGVRLREMRRREDRRWLVRIAVAGACAGNVMMLAVALYGGMIHGIEAQYETLFRWSSLLVSLPAVLWSAGVFFQGAWGSLRARALHMDVPIAIGISAGFAWGAANTIRGSGEIYFDSVTALIFLLLVGRYLQRRRQRAAADAVELLDALTPSSARIVEDGRTHRVPLESLRPGMVVEVRAGESIPVDGTVASGRTDLDISLLTGESRPQEAGEGERVHAGTVNLTSLVRVHVEAAGESTRVGRLTRLMEEASRRRPPVVRLADRISGYFVAAVLALACVTAAIWWWIDPSRAIENTIALLVVTCPCALGLATPLAVSAAIGSAGRAGILIKGGDVLERLARPGKMLLDKTGTLTEGRMALVRWWGDEKAKPLVLALETQVAHPVARAFEEALGGTGPVLACTARRVERGAGVSGEVAGRRVVAGSPAFVESVVGRAGEQADLAVSEMTEAGLTPVVIAVDGRVSSVAGLGDPVRADAEATVRGLKSAGWSVGILSGDHPDVVASVARRIDIDPGAGLGGVTPEEKLKAVERAAADGPVVMVGDGINDAAALSAATVGVAVRGGAEVAMSVADVFLGRSGLGQLDDLVQGSRRTLSVIRRNLVFSLLYNLGGAALAMSGWVHPLAAAVLMPLSSLTVITHSYRARTFRAPAR